VDYRIIGLSDYRIVLSNKTSRTGFWILVLYRLKYDWFGTLLELDEGGEVHHEVAGDAVLGDLRGELEVEHVAVDVLHISPVEGPVVDEEGLLHLRLATDVLEEDEGARHAVGDLLLVQIAEEAVHRLDLLAGEERVLLKGADDLLRLGGGATLQLALHIDDAGLVVVVGALLPVDDLHLDDGGSAVLDREAVLRDETEAVGASNTHHLRDLDRHHLGGGEVDHLHLGDTARGSGVHEEGRVEKLVVDDSDGHVCLWWVV